MTHDQHLSCDVAIVGGGPGGTTVASFLKRYSPQLDVVIIEKERFLPPTSKVLHEMGAWDKIEAAGFPIKLGASYTWGKTTEPWVFGFIPVSEIGSTDRPGKYEGWRQKVAFQVDRSIYDSILLEHAKSLGVRVVQPARVVKVHRDAGSNVDSRIQAITLEDGTQARARYYVDASGNAAVLRRQLGIEVEAPSLLKNVAFWDYWTAPGLNERLLEHGTMRVMIRSVSFGWIWYIVLSNDRTSVGLVCNAEYYKASGKSPEQLYRQALAEESSIAELLKSATSSGSVEGTTDWSYVASRTYGENWFLVGESLGFADPILAAGLTLTHTCAQHCAYTILDLDRGTKDRRWLLDQYHETQTRRVRQHIKFAEYWYSANGLFTDVLDNCAAIANQSGLQFGPQEAFRWLSHGGVDDIPGQFVIGGLGLSGIKSVQKRFAHTESSEVAYLISGMNTFELDLAGSTQSLMALPNQGEVQAVPVLIRGSARLPVTGFYGQIYSILRQYRYVDQIVPALQNWIQSSGIPAHERTSYIHSAFHCLESMVAQGWVKASHTEGRAALSMQTPDEGEIVYTERLGPRAKKM